MPPPPAPHALPWHRRLEARVLLGATLIAGLTLVAVVAATRQVVTRSSLEHARADVHTARDAFSRLVTTRADVAAKSARLVIELPLFRSMLTDHRLASDPPTMNATTSDYCTKLDANLCVVTDAAGRWIGRAGVWPAPAPPPAVTALIASATAGHASRDLVTLGGHLYQVIAEPAMFDRNEVLGSFTALYVLDDAVAGQLAREADCDVSLICEDGRICASSLPAGPRAALVADLAADPRALGGVDDTPALRSVGDASYVGGVYTLRDTARLVLLQDWRPTEEAVAKIHGAVLWIGIVSFGVALVGTLILGRRMTRPLHTLAAVATDVAQGHWERLVPLDGPAEARVTAEAFNQMTVALSHWHEAAESRAEELRASYERFRAVTDSASDAIVSIDARGHIVFWSLRAEAVFGYDRRDAIGQRFAQLVPERHRAAYADQLAGLASGADDGPRVGTTLEMCGLRRDGSEVPLELSLSTWKAGPDTFYTAVIRDITERKQAARALREREDQLRQAQKMEAIGRLAGGVAHDFNNLLTAILGYTHLIQASLPDGDPMRADLDEIEKASDSAASLTRELLAFSRKQVLQPVVLDLNAVVAGTEKLLGRIVGEDVELVLALAPDLDRVRADRSQVEQVIMNLAVNARDAMPRGGRLTIATGIAPASTALDAPVGRGDAPAAAGRHVMLTVGDTGCGMTDDVLAHIFEPFFTTKELGKGTGLGLATVYGIVQQSGGYIRVDSEAGRGSQFHICLPAVEATADDEPVADVVTPTERGSEMVLLVEDNEAVRGLARETLVRAGYDVLEATNGAEALRVAADQLHRLAVVVTDVVMPVMGGNELAGRLRALRRDIRIVFTSGYADDAAGGTIRPGLGGAFLQKPFTPGDLTRLVRDVIDAPLPVAV